MNLHQKIQHAQKSLLRSLKPKTIASIFVASALLYTLPARALTSYLGINNGTGYNTEPEYVDRSIQHTKDLNLEVARMGMDGVGGFTEGAGFNWSARDAAIDRYLNAGLKIHLVLSSRA
ncbi:MAG: hypothetical protein N4J56_000870 [Chroococcidiopsis sp. SAG 2025]|nr:hypothetical protein [Chroococcidiopsis sp. SAG 2025]